MGVHDVREDHTIKDSQGGTQTQSVVRRSSPLANEDPSTLKFVIDNAVFIDTMMKRLTGWNLVYDDMEGKSVPKHNGRPIINDIGQGWVGVELASITDKMQGLSNYLAGDIDTKKRAEALLNGGTLLKRRMEFGIESITDCRDINVILMRATDASYNRALNDRGARHFFGSLDEGVTITPKPDRKLFGLIPY